MYYTPETIHIPLLVILVVMVLGHRRATNKWCTTQNSRWIIGQSSSG